MLPRFVHSLLIAAWMAMVGLFAPIPAALADPDVPGYTMLADVGQMPAATQAENMPDTGTLFTDSRLDQSDNCANCHAVTLPDPVGRSTAGLPPPEWMHTVLRAWSVVPRAPPWLRYC